MKEKEWKKELWLCDQCSSSTLITFHLYFTQELVLHWLWDICENLSSEKTNILTNTTRCTQGMKCWLFESLHPCHIWSLRTCYMSAWSLREFIFHALLFNYSLKWKILFSVALFKLKKIWLNSNKNDSTTSVENTSLYNKYLPTDLNTGKNLYRITIQPKRGQRWIFEYSIGLK